MSRDRENHLNVVFRTRPLSGEREFNLGGSFVIRGV
jgi:hypothetical protein